MDQKAESALQFFREKIGEFHRKRDEEHDRSASLNLYEVLAELKTKDKNAVATVTRLLNDKDASDMHYWMLAALRGLAQRGPVSYTTARQILKSTEQSALGDADEWFRSVQALVRTPQGIRALFEFIDRLLNKHEMYNWRWFAFYITGTIFYYNKSSVPESLKERLKAQIDQEPDPHDRKYMQEVADIF